MFFLQEKDLVHKLFKVLVPRYEQFYHRESITDMWRLPNKLPGDGQSMSVLELKGKYSQSASCQYVDVALKVGEGHTTAILFRLGNN